MAKVLVVDDSRLTRRLIVSALEKAGHDIVQAQNGEEGLKAFRAFNPDCVMSDLLMPVMDGFELTRELRSLDPFVPILISTADIQERSRERCEELRVTRMLNKPLKPQEICDAVADAISSQEVATQ
ncbi:MAG: response regulator [Planctomycetota bacterium]